MFTVRFENIQAYLYLKHLYDNEHRNLQGAFLIHVLLGTQVSDLS